MKPLSVNWFGAFLYLPTPSNWASIPSLSSVPLKKVTSAARPEMSSMAVGDAAIFWQPVARKYSRLPATSRWAQDGLPLRRKRTSASRTSAVRAQPASSVPTRSSRPRTFVSAAALSIASTTVRSDGGRVSSRPARPVAGCSGSSPSRSSDRYCPPDQLSDERLPPRTTTATAPTAAAPSARAATPAASTQAVRFFMAGPQP